VEIASKYGDVWEPCTLGLRGTKVPLCHPGRGSIPGGRAGGRPGGWNHATEIMVTRTQAQELAAQGAAWARLYPAAADRPRNVPDRDNLLKPRRRQAQKFRGQMKVVGPLSDCRRIHARESRSKRSAWPPATPTAPATRRACASS
jgi:hypothetical protein